MFVIGSGYKCKESVGMEVPVTSRLHLTNHCFAQVFEMMVDEADFAKYKQMLVCGYFLLSFTLHRCCCMHVPRPDLHSVVRDCVICSCAAALVRGQQRSDGLVPRS